MSHFVNQAFSDDQEIRACLSMLDDQEVVTCKNRIVQSIKKESVIFTDGKSRQVMTPQFKEVWDKLWAPFIGAFIDCVLVLGEVPVAIVKSDEPGFEGVLYPVVPPLGTFMIGVEQQGYKVVHRFYSRNSGSYASVYDDGTWQGNAGRKRRPPRASGKASIDDILDPVEGGAPPPMIIRSVVGVVEDPSVTVYKGFGFDVDVNGKLHSPMRTLLNCRTFTEMMKKCAVAGELHNVNPLVYLENQTNKISFDETNNARISADMAEGTRKIKDAMRLVDESLYYRTREQNERMYSEGMGLVPNKRDPRKGSVADPASAGAEISLDLPRPPSHQVMLASGAKLTHQLQARPRDDLPDIIDQGSDIIHKVLGVPASVFTISSVNKGNVDGINRTMEETLDFWRNAVGKTLTSVHNLVYGKHDAAYKASMLRRSITESMADPGHVVPYGDIMDGIASVSSKTSINIEPAPRATPTELMEIHKMGLLSYQEFANMAYSVLSIPGGGMSDKLEDPLTPEERRQVILNSYGLSTRENQNNGTDTATISGATRKRPNDSYYSSDGDGVSENDEPRRQTRTARQRKRDRDDDRRRYRNRNDSPHSSESNSSSGEAKESSRRRKPKERERQKARSRRTNKDKHGNS